MDKPYIIVHDTSDGHVRTAHIFINNISAITYQDGHTYIILNNYNLEVDETPEDILEKISAILNRID